jgi:hypothetical protein
MKAIVFEQKISRNYFLGSHFIYNYFGFEPVKLSVDSILSHR